VHSSYSFCYSISVLECAILCHQSHRPGTGVHFRTNSRYSCLEHLDLHAALRRQLSRYEDVDMLIFELLFTMELLLSRVYNGRISHTAPVDCLQYFPTRSGRVRSFNWRDVAGTATRQLANQDYSICFRRASSNTVSFLIHSIPRSCERN
jgi:hypothetical protein